MEVPQAVETSPNTKVESNPNEPTESSIAVKVQPKNSVGLPSKSNLDQHLRKDEGDQPPQKTEGAIEQTFKEEYNEQLDYMQQSMGEELQYYENPELYDPNAAYYYGYVQDLQDSSYSYGRGRSYFRGRAYQVRGQSWKRNNPSTLKKKKSEEKLLAEPISDLHSWPTLETAV